MIIPTYEALVSYAPALATRYAAEVNKNPERENLIALMCLICSHINKNWPKNRQDEVRPILFGMYLFGLVLIEDEYNVMTIRSRVYQWVRQEFGLSDSNQATPEDQLIYVSKFFHFIKDYFPEALSTLAPPFNDQTKALEKILAMMKRVLEEQVKAIRQLLAERPAPTVFKKSITDLQHRYQSIASQRYSVFRNKDRENLVQLIAYLNESCEALYPNEREEGEDGLLLQSTAVREGLVVYVLSTLEAECKFKLPASFLFKYVCEARNVTQVNDIPLEERETGLNSLKAHLIVLKTNKVWLDKAESFKLKEIEKQFTGIERWIDIELGRIAFEKTRPGYVEAKVKALSTYLATYGVQTAVQTVASQYLLPSVGGTLIDGAAGTVGFVVFGPSGALVASQLSRIARDRLLPTVFTAVFGSVFNQIGEAIAGVTTGIVILPFTATAAGLQSLLDLYYTLHPKHELSYDKLAWVEALLSLPESIFPETDKTKLSQLQGKSQLALAH